VSDPVIFGALGFAGGAVAFGWGFRQWRWLRLIEDTPTAKVRSMPMGRVEIFGRAEEKAELLAPLSGVRCVYYRYRVEELRGTGKNRRWKTIDSGESAAWGFYLEDDTGRVFVAPKGAAISVSADLEVTRGGLLGFFDRAEPALDTSRWEERSGWNPRRRRYTEWRIEPGDFVYVLGIAQERPGLADERRRRVVEKLRAIKADPDAMTHFDVDGDGSVTTEEWEVARQLTASAVAREPVEDRIVVAADPGGGSPFMISDRSERSLRSRHLARAVLGIFGGAIGSVACLVFLLGRFGVLGGS